MIRKKKKKERIRDDDDDADLMRCTISEEKLTGGQARYTFTIPLIGPLLES